MQTSTTGGAGGLDLRGNKPKLPKVDQPIVPIIEIFERLFERKFEIAARSDFSTSTLASQRRISRVCSVAVGIVAPKGVRTVADRARLAVYTN